MIKINNIEFKPTKYPDGTFCLKIPEDIVETIVEAIRKETWIYFSWYYENEEENILLYYLRNWTLEHYPERDCHLFLEYVPNARQDRVKNTNEVFTLKYFADFINSLKFRRVYTADVHSNVAKALINHIDDAPGDMGAIILLGYLNDKNIALFFPDEGATKRYSSKYLRKYPITFGVKKRNWETGVIEGLDIVGDVENNVKGKNILIIDDICSKGGTFYHSAKKLKELGANKIYLYVTHCEKSIFDGELINSDLIETIFTTPTIFKPEWKTDKIKVIDYTMEFGDINE